MRKEDRGPQIVKPPGASVPMPVGKESDLTRIAEQSLEAAARDKYRGDDPRFQGKTYIEAAVISLVEDAPHDPDARKELLDRSMGKPRQKIDSTSQNITLIGFLQGVADEEEQVVDAEFTEETDADERMFQ